MNVTLPKCESLTSKTVETLINNTYKYVGLDPTLGLERWRTIAATKERAQAWAMAKEVLNAKQARRLASTTDMTRLLNYIFCYVGLSVGFPGGDGWVVEPNTTTINLVTADTQAAFVLPPGSIEQTSLLAITSTTDTLRTNLDKYPIVRQFSKYPSNKFAVPAGVYICASVPLSNQNNQAILNRMRLGHNIGTTGFEILPYTADGIPLLNCNENILADAPPSVLERAVDLFLPKYLLAQKYITRGCAGVGGTVSELSPIGPVDPQINVTATSTISQSAPAGALVSSTPGVRLFTSNGRSLANIPVTFSVVTGGGVISPTTPVLTTTAGTAISTSWRLGTAPATNVARGTPALGGPAVQGTFFSPTVIDFTAFGFGSPSGILLAGGPAANTSFVAGVTLPTLSARIVDANQNTVTNFTGTVAAASTVSGSLRGTLSVAAVSGVATFSNLQAGTVGSQAIRVSTTSGTTALAATGNTFSVTPAAASTLTIIGGNATVANVGSSPTSLPSVRVTDAFGNLVPNAAVYFGPSNNSSSITPVNTVSTASGTATASTWPLQIGTNNLMATLDSPVNRSIASRRVEFSATGNTISNETTLIPCNTLGTAKDLIRSTAILWLPTSAQQARTITNVKLWLSTGQYGTTNTPIPYNVRLEAQLFNGTTLLSTLTSSTSTAILLGTTAENKQVNFFFPTTRALTSVTRVIFRVTDVNLLANSPVRFAGGGGSACNNTEVVNTTTLARVRLGSAMQVITR
jgi:hypothetical protein